MIKLKVGGSFRTNPGIDTNRNSFNDLVVEIPKVERLGTFKNADGTTREETQEDFYTQSALRMFPIWLRKNKKFADCVFEGVIKLFVDSDEELDKEPSCAGVDVKEMNWEQLQEMACILKLREIPLFRVGDIRQARERAYVTYMKVIKKKVILKSPLDKKKLLEKIERRYEDAELTMDELQAKKDKALEDSFNMIVDQNNLRDSYNFAKLPKLIAVAKKTVDNSNK